ncbi:AraC family transcriptional regulator [Alteribacillus sp. HJP-4]|uniref:AraC family transcriptional regulator n=1 Tax=Alteribacillus sp. HJP-4 TaxID=2775394 RepID=UPI0035CCE8E6
MSKSLKKRKLLGENYFNRPAFPFFIDRYCIAENTHVHPHNHDFLELVYVIEGNAVHHIGQQSYQVQAGNVFLLEPDVYHHFTAAESGDTIVYNVLFRREFLKNELSFLSQLPSFINYFYLLPFLRKTTSFIPYLPLDMTQKLQIERHLDDIHKEFHSKADGFELIIKTRLIEVFILLSRFYNKSKTQPQVSLNDEETVKSISEFITRHYNQPITLAQLSQTYGMSISSLTAKFKAFTGMTIIEFRQKQQVKEACAALSDTNNKIADIAFECGFNDLSHFNRNFKKHTGMSPRDFAKQSALQ